MVVIHALIESVHDLPPQEELPHFLHEFSSQQTSQIAPNTAAIAGEAALQGITPDVQPETRRLSQWRNLLNRIHPRNWGSRHASIESEVDVRTVDTTAFYEEQSHRWSEAPYTPEDLATLFTPDHLSSLTLDQYALLMRRFPGELVTHVTRQGIRDHTGMVYHTEGQGSYMNGFAAMLDDHRIRSPLGVYMKEEEKEAAIRDFLHLDRFADREKAHDKLNGIIHSDLQGNAGSYADRNAIHFAAEEVCDAYYGSEQGNEIFIAFPAAMIASQYHFNGDPTDGSGGYWNDLWVWSHEQEGIPLDAGLVFIPANARVDRTTGSRYQIDENGNPRPNTAGAQKIEEILAWPELHAFQREVSNSEYESGRSTNPDDDYLAPFREKLAEKFGITNRTLLDAVLDANNLSSLVIEQQEETPLPEMQKATIEGVLASAGLLYLTAENTIPSRQYWEDYFAHTGWRPSKVVFYEGEDPTAALHRWRAENRIDKRSNDPYFGFGDHHVKRGHEVTTRGIDRFHSLALNAIENYFKYHQQ